MDVFLNNPIALLFLSFMMGALLHTAFAKQGWYQKYFYKLNFTSDKATKLIGVLWIEWLILKTPLRLFNQQLKITGRPTKDQLLQLRDVMTAAELSHLMGFVVIIPIIIYYVVSGQSLLLISSMVILNVLFNGYTALTQQYNKRRLDKVLERME